VNSALVPEYWRRRKFTASVRVRESFSLCEQFAYQAGQATRIAVLHINRSGVVEGIVGALGNAQAHANHIFRARQVSQIRLGFESRRKGWVGMTMTMLWGCFSNLL